MQTRNVRATIQAWVAVVAVAVAGCGSDAPPRVRPHLPAANAAEQALAECDTNRDGLLDAAELDGASGLRSALRRIDTNGDGKLSAAEIRSRLASWADSRVGRVSVSCLVTRQGVPLANAQVRWVPESFLGDQIPVASGTTDDQGLAFLSLPDDSMPGVSPGFYRIEVQPSGSSVPIQLPLGAEVALDAEELTAGSVQLQLP